MTDEILELEHELEDAKADLGQSLTEVSRKVETVEEQFRPEHLVHRHPFAVLSVAAAAGFVIGNAESRSSLLGALVLGSLIGLGARPSAQSNHGFSRNGSSRNGSRRK